MLSTAKTNSKWREKRSSYLWYPPPIASLLDMPQIIIQADILAGLTRSSSNTFFCPFTSTFNDAIIFRQNWAVLKVVTPLALSHPTHPGPSTPCLRQLSQSHWWSWPWCQFFSSHLWQLLPVINGQYDCSAPLSYPAPLSWWSWDSQIVQRFLWPSQRHWAHWHHLNNGGSHHDLGLFFEGIFSSQNLYPPASCGHGQRIYDNRA